MPFAVGEHIVHPVHGPGTVQDITEQELIKGHDRYYVIGFVDKGLTVQMPVDRAEDLGVRAVMAQTKYSEVISFLRLLPTQLPNDFKSRRKLLEDWVESGAPLRLAQAVRELSWRRTQRNLNNADREIYQRAQDRLVAEMAMATGSPRAKMLTLVSEALEAGRARKHEEVAAAD